MASIPHASISGTNMSCQPPEPCTAAFDPVPIQATKSGRSVQQIDVGGEASAYWMRANDRRLHLEPAELVEPSHWAALGTALRECGRYGEARTAFREARRLAPHDIDIILGLAYLEMECGRHQHACDMFQIVLDRLPTRIDIVIRAARAHFELGKTKRAKALIEGRRGCRMDEALTAELAALKINIGRMREGLSILRGVSDLSRTSVYALAWLASALAQTTHLKKARHCLALLPSPEKISNPALREEILTASARIAMQGGNLFGARRFLEFLDTPPAPGFCRGAKPYFLLAEVCFRQMDMEVAKSAMITGHCMRMKAADIASPLMIEFS